MSSERRASSMRKGHSPAVTRGAVISPVRRRSMERVDRTRRRSKVKKPEDKESPAGGSSGIRTRLSTGSIHMNGTSTIPVAKELEMTNKLISKTQTPPETPSPAQSRKRLSSAADGAGPGYGQNPPPKKRKIGRNDGSGEDNRNDYFCWLCHREGVVVCCELCPRVYHTKCLGLGDDLPQDWVCPECEKIMRSECIDTRSKAMQMISVDTLCTLLKHALERMKHQGSDPFHHAVDLATVPSYTDYIFNPMDLATLEKNIKKKMYGCTEAFLSDTKWILHNCLIFNGAHHKLTGSAKMIVKICKHEMNEIELCPDCYLNSCIRKNDEWFSEPCRKPHTLVWAKLKGYPFWPAKALREMDGQVDVRFFGAHDRSWVPVSQCFLLSKDIPTSIQKGKKSAGLDNAMEELELHIKKIKQKFGKFDYAPFRTPYDKNDSYKPIKVSTMKKGMVLRGAKGTLKLISSGSSDNQARVAPTILKHSVTVRTASALKSKYSSLATTRKGITSTPEKASNNTSEKASEELMEDDSTENGSISTRRRSEALTASAKLRILYSCNLRKVTSPAPAASNETVASETNVSTESEPVVSKGTVASETKPVSAESDVSKETLTSETKPVSTESVVSHKTATSETKTVSIKPVVPKDTSSGEKRTVSTRSFLSNKGIVEKLENKMKEIMKGDEESKDTVHVADAETNVSSADVEKSGRGDKQDVKLENPDGSGSKPKQDVVDDKKKEKGNDDREIGKDNKEIGKISHEQKVEGVKKEKNCTKNEGDKTTADSSGGKSEKTSNENMEETDSEKLRKNEKTEISASKIVEELKEKCENKDQDRDTSSDILVRTDSPSKRDYLQKLQKTIESCKAKLGLSGEEEICEEVEEVESDEEEGGKVQEGDGEERTDETEQEKVEEKFENSDKTKGVEAGKNKSADELKRSDSEESEETDINQKSSEKKTNSKEDKGLSEELPAEVKDKEQDKCKVVSGKSKVNSSEEIKDKAEGAVCEGVEDKAEGAVSEGVKDKAEGAVSGGVKDKTVEQREGALCEDSSKGKESLDDVTRTKDSQEDVDANKTLKADSSEGLVKVDKKLEETDSKARDETTVSKGDETSAMELEDDDDDDTGLLMEVDNESDSETDKLAIDLSQESDSEMKDDGKECNISNSAIPKKTSASKEQTSDDKRESAESQDSEKKEQANSTILKHLNQKIQSSTTPKMSPTVPTETKSPSPPKTNTVSKEPPLMSPPKPTQSSENKGDNSDSVKVDKLEDEVIQLHGKKAETKSSEIGTGSSLTPVPESKSKDIVSRFTKQLMDSIKTTFDKMSEEIATVEQQQPPPPSDSQLQAELERARWEHSQELVELKHNFKLTMAEMKHMWEGEKTRVILETKQQCEKEKEKAVQEAKKKQWCASCGKEAIFYCCWNTSYCDYPCQQKHWPTHMHSCLQSQQSTTTATTISAPSVPRTSTPTQNQGQSSTQKERSRSGGSNTSGSSAGSGGNIGSNSGSPIDLDANAYRRRVRDDLTAALHQEEDRNKGQRTPQNNNGMQFMSPPPVPSASAGQPINPILSMAQSVVQISQPHPAQFNSQMSPGNQQQMVMSANQNSPYMGQIPVQLQGPRSTVLPPTRPHTGMMPPQNQAMIYPVQLQSGQPQIAPHGNIMNPIYFTPNPAQSQGLVQGYPPRPPF